AQLLQPALPSVRVRGGGGAHTRPVPGPAQGGGDRRRHRRDGRPGDDHRPGRGMQGAPSGPGEGGRGGAGAGDHGARERPRRDPGRPGGAGAGMRRLRWALPVLIVVACAGYLVYTATGTSAEYYQTVSEARAHPASGDVRVLGVVQEGIERSNGGLDLKFT